MRWSADKLRWVVLAGALLLAGVVAALFGLANYRAGKVWQRILARNGVNLQQETNSFTYSQSDGKRTIFTLHAAKAVPHGNGNWTLRNAVLILYARDGRSDRIYGSQFQYDQHAGVARAIGEVHMDLEAPRSAGLHPEVKSDLTFTPGEESAEDPALIHVRTSGLVYARKLGVAATNQPTEFRYEGLTCTSRGAEFDSGQDHLRLLADVHMTGKLRQAPFTLLAASADLDRHADSVELSQPQLASAGRSARASHAVLHLRQDGSLQTGEADGDVQLHAGTQTVRAPELQARFGAQNRPEQVLLSGGVSFTDSDVARPEQGAARSVRLSMDPAGLLSGVVAEGAVRLGTEVLGAGNSPLKRHLQAETATARFVTVSPGAKRTVLHSLQLVGAAEMGAESAARVASGSSAAGVVNTTVLDADQLTTIFAADRTGRAQPRTIEGSGHTQLDQAGPRGRQSSTGDRLEVSFAQRAVAPAKQASAMQDRAQIEVASAVQSGHVLLRSWSPAKTNGTGPGPAFSGTSGGFSTGHAQRAAFEAAAGTLTLTGAAGEPAEVDDSARQLRAQTIVLHQATGDGEASGGVAATTGGNGGSPAAHVLASRATLLHATELSQFFGTDTQPAQLWEGGSQVRAARIVLDGRRHTLSARPENPGGKVNAVFARAASAAERSPVPASGQGGEAARREEKRNRAGIRLPEARLPEASRDTILVRAAAMDFNDAEHEAVFTGGLTVRDPAGEVTGDHGAAFLQAGAAAATGRAAATARGAQQEPTAAVAIGGKLDRLVILGNVHLRQTGRLGSGEQLTYTAATNSFLLTGTAADPPRVTDARQGIVTGAALLFGASDSSIVVMGSQAAGKQGKPTRVHTETDLKQQ